MEEQEKQRNKKDAQKDSTLQPITKANSKLEKELQEWEVDSTHSGDWLRWLRRKRKSGARIEERRISKKDTILCSPRCSFSAQLFFHFAFIDYDGDTQSNECKLYHFDNKWCIFDELLVYRSLPHLFLYNWVSYNDKLPAPECGWHLAPCWHS